MPLYMQMLLKNLGVVLFGVLIGGLIVKGLNEFGFVFLGGIVIVLLLAYILIKLRNKSRLK